MVVVVVVVVVMNFDIIFIVIIMYIYICTRTIDWNSQRFLANPGKCPLLPKSFLRHPGIIELELYQDVIVTDKINVQVYIMLQTMVLTLVSMPSAPSLETLWNSLMCPGNPGLSLKRLWQY